MYRRAERSNGRREGEALGGCGVYSRVKRSSSFAKRSRPSQPKWVPLTRFALGAAFSWWMIWTILDADKLKPGDLAVRFVVAAVALAGAIVLGRLYPEAKKKSRLGDAR